MDDTTNFSRRPCNYLESIFFNCNVRFVVGISCREEKKTTNNLKNKQHAIAAFEGTIKKLGTNIHIITSSSSSSGKDNETNNCCYIDELNEDYCHDVQIIIHNRSSKDKTTTTTTTTNQNNNNNNNDTTLRDLVNQNIQQNIDPKEPLKLTLVVSDNVNCNNDNNNNNNNDDDDNSIVEMAIFNVNHALMDAIAIKLFLKHWWNEMNEINQTEKYKQLINNVDWGFYARKYHPASSHSNNNDDNNNNNNQQFSFLPLPFDGPPMTIAEILKKDNDTTTSPHKGDDSNDSLDSNHDVVAKFDSDLVNACKRAAREHETTLTGLWMACIFRALADIASDNSDDNKKKRKSQEEGYPLALSVLVDLRKWFSEKDESLLSLSQVQSTVTVGCLVSAAVATKNDNNNNLKQALQDWIWKTAKDSTNQLQERISNGEAHQQAIFFATGGGGDGGGDNHLHDKNDNNIDCSGFPFEATVELSNHGIYPALLPDIEVSQRFDGYEGLSIIVHSHYNSSSNNSNNDIKNEIIMKGTASFGSNLCPIKTRKFMNRIYDLFQLAVNNN